MPPVTHSCAASAAVNLQQPPTTPPPPPVNPSTIFTIPEKPKPGVSNLSHLGYQVACPEEVYRTPPEGWDLPPHLSSIPTEHLSNPFCRTTSQVTFGERA